MSQIIIDIKNSKFGVMKALSQHVMGKGWRDCSLDKGNIHYLNDIFPHYGAFDP